jgi:hypothetical protein
MPIVFRETSKNHRMGLVRFGTWWAYSWNRTESPPVVHYAEDPLDTARVESATVDGSVGQTSMSAFRKRAPDDRQFGREWLGGLRIIGAKDLIKALVSSAHRDPHLAFAGIAARTTKMLSARRQATPARTGLIERQGDGSQSGRCANGHANHL